MNGIFIKPVMPRAQRYRVKVAGPARHTGTLSLMMHFRRDTTMAVNPTGNTTELRYRLQIVTLFVRHWPSAMS